MCTLRFPVTAWNWVPRSAKFNCAGNRSGIAVLNSVRLILFTLVRRKSYHSSTVSSSRSVMPGTYKNLGRPSLLGRGGGAAVAGGRSPLSRRVEAAVAGGRSGVRRRRLARNLERPSGMGRGLSTPAAGGGRSGSVRRRRLAAAVSRSSSSACAMRRSSSSGSSGTSAALGAKNPSPALAAAGVPNNPILAPIRSIANRIAGAGIPYRSSTRSAALAKSAIVVPANSPVALSRCIRSARAFINASRMSFVRLLF